MDNIVIKNFTKMQELHVGSSINEDHRIGALVTVAAHAGSMAMHFSMRPDQARYMAIALIKHAENLDDMENEQ